MLLLLFVFAFVSQMLFIVFRVFIKDDISGLFATNGVMLSAS